MDRSMLKSLEIFLFAILLSVTLADWNEYIKELDHLQFQNSEVFQEHMKHYISMAEVPKTTPFPCQRYELEQKTKSVHYLRPGDVRVVGALGDSITAGNGIRAKTVIGSLIQFRGYSWSVGGQSSSENDVKILPNILKNYNPDLTCYSTGIGIQGSDNAQCNVAAPGNKAEDMPDQARLLVEELKKFEGNSFQDDWKMITMFIGGNDLCNYCKDPLSYSAENYTNFISEALDELYANVPKAFVNVVTILDLSEIGDLNGGVICDVLHWKLCECAVDEGTRLVVKEMAKEYTLQTEKLIASGRYDTRDDFTVVIQPFLKEHTIPRLESGEGDLSYFAYDCFHFNQKGQNAMATALWNSMFEPVGNKNTKANFNASLYCPGKDEPFATAVNSQKDDKQNLLKVQQVVQDGDHSHVVVQDGTHNLFLLMVLSVMAVAVIGYGTFFAVQWRIKKNGSSVRAETRDLLVIKPHTSYQSIS